MKGDGPDVLPLLPDERWVPLAEFLRGLVRPGEILLAPYELIHLFPGTVALHVRKGMLGGAAIAHFVLQRNKLHHVDPGLLRDAAALAPVYADPLFAVFSARGAAVAAGGQAWLKPVLDHAAAAPSASSAHVAAVVATHNRAWALKRSLRSLARQFTHIAVIDDASRPWQALQNRMAANQAGAAYLRIPSNLGLAHALNVGIGHWLAHREIGWISVFNDDVELAPGALAALAEIAAEAPCAADALLLSGYQSPLHRVHASDTIAGYGVNLARSCSGQHLHAHRDYWRRVLPIPTSYLGAPKSEGGLYPNHGADEDWWVASWAPGAGIKRGGAIVVVPGLVTTFGRGRSTWNAPGI